MQLFLHIHWLNIWRFNQSQVTNIWNKIPEISKKAKLEFCTYILRLNGSCITNIYTKKFFRQITELIFLKKFRICITENACILSYSVHFSSVAQSCPTLWDPMNRSLSITNSQSLLKLMPIESVMPSSHLFLCRPLLLLPPIPPSIRDFSDESTLHMRWPNYWSFSFSISPTNEHPGLFSFRMDRLDLLAVQGTLKSLLQNHSSKASIFQCSAFLTVQLSHSYMTTGKTIALTIQNFVGKVMSLLLNMLSRLVITSLPRSERLLISWLQSPSAVALEPQKNKVWHCLHCLPIYFPWGDGTRCHDLSFLNAKL